MRLLLDTHALLWWLSGDRMSEEATSAISDPTTEAVVSAASIWEAAIKASAGKLQVEGSLVDEALAHGFDLLAISGRHAEAAGRLPAHHRDPFDRMIVAQAQTDGYVVVTRDSAFASYQVALLTC